MTVSLLSGVESGLGIGLLSNPYVIVGTLIIIVVAAIAIFIRGRKGRAKAGATGDVENQAIMYSTTQRIIIDVRPFAVRRKFDHERNIEETRAIFPKLEQESVQARRSGLGKFFKDALKGIQRSAQTQQVEEDGVIFNEGIAIYNQSKRGWLAMFSLENNTQLPIFAVDGDNKKQIDQIERTVEKRVSRLKAGQQAVLTYVQSATPIQALSTVQLISFVLIFISIIALSYSVNAAGNTVHTAITQVSTLLGQIPPKTG